MVRLLVEHGAQVDGVKVGEMNSFPLYDAACVRRIRILRIAFLAYLLTPHLSTAALKWPLCCSSTMQMPTGKHRMALHHFGPQRRCVLCFCMRVCHFPISSFACQKEWSQRDRCVAAGARCKTICRPSTHIRAHTAIHGSSGTLFCNLFAQCSTQFISTGTAILLRCWSPTAPMSTEPQKTVGKLHRYLWRQRCVHSAVFAVLVSQSRTDSTDAQRLCRRCYVRVPM